MSTKTTFKRIALVTVAALGFGVLSVVPSSAVSNADSLTLSSATAAQTTAETATATSATATFAWLAGDDTESFTVVASLVSGPAGNTALPYLQLVETASAQVGNNNLTPIAKTTGYVSPNNKANIWSTAASAAAASAKFKVWVGSGTGGVTAPTKVGTYVVKLTPAVVAGGGVLNATAQTLTITVTQAAALDTVAVSATSIISAADTNTATADEVVTAAKTITLATDGTQTPAAVIRVTLKNAAAATTTGESYTATIAGSGTLGIGRWDGLASIPDTYVAQGRAITVRAGDAVQVFADGSSGVGTVTISSAAGLVLATEKVTFFGTATSIVTSVVTDPLAVGANADALSVVVKDAAGTIVSTDGILYVTSDTVGKVSTSYAKTCSFSIADQVHYCSLTGVAAGTANITVGTKSSATDTTVGAINGNTVAVRVGTTTPASVKVTLDKSSYAPGEKATLTVQLYDADGKVVGDGDYTSIFATGGLKSNFELGATSDTLTSTGVFRAVAGKKTYTIYMPAVTGEVTITGKTAGTAVTGTAPSALTGLAVANQAVAISVTATVANPGVDAAAAAAEEATAAANDATDAALSAAEAAEAATAAAQEAVDAVAELSTQVTKLISELKAQLTALTNLVVKIQKKVKA